MRHASSKLWREVCCHRMSSLLPSQWHSVPLQHWACAADRKGGNCCIRRPHKHNSIMLMRIVGSFIPQSTMTSHPVVGDTFMYAWQLAASWSCIDYLLCRIIHSSVVSCVCLQHAEIASSPEDSLEPRPSVYCTLYPWLPAPTDNQSTVHALE